MDVSEEIDIWKDVKYVGDRPTRLCGDRFCISLTGVKEDSRSVLKHLTKDAKTSIFNCILEHVQLVCKTFEEMTIPASII